MAATCALLVQASDLIRLFFVTDLNHSKAPRRPRPTLPSSLVVWDDRLGNNAFPTRFGANARRELGFEAGRQAGRQLCMIHRQGKGMDGNDSCRHVFWNALPFFTPPLADQKKSKKYLPQTPHHPSISAQSGTTTNLPLTRPMLIASPASSGTTRLASGTTLIDTTSCRNDALLPGVSS